MSSSEGALAHLSYFECLATLDDGSNEWRAVSAGLVTMRLFDVWIGDGASAPPDAWGMRAVREAIDAIESGNSVRQLLCSVVECMGTPGSELSTVAPRLLAYARALQFDARWELAVDVYSTLLRVAHPDREADLVIAAYMQLGRSLRVLARWEEAEAAYTAAGDAATEVGDATNALRSRIGLGNLAIDAGNLPQAERVLDETVKGADALGLTEIRSLALQDRANAANHRGDYELAVRLLYRALTGLRDQTARDRVLLDLASCFFELGARTVSRDAYLLLVATAQEQYTRWLATINLIDVAATDRREPVFEQYRRELAAVTMPPLLQGYYLLYTGRGYHIFDRPTLARTTLERAIAHANAHRLNQILIEAEQLLLDVGTGRELPAAATASLSEDTRAVADAIRELRTLAGVSG